MVSGHQRWLARDAHNSHAASDRCTVCGRTFNKKKMDGKLNVHKNRSGSLDNKAIHASIRGINSQSIRFAALA
jgi:hypothetical protein